MGNKPHSLNQVLLSLSKLESIDSGDITVALQKVTEAMSEALNVARASVWFYNDDESAIICRNLFERDENRHSAGSHLFAHQFPNYFKYLYEERTLSANNAHTNPATYEFSEVYLKPLNIMSMLDAPIRLNGKMIGVICFEHIKTERKWSLADQGFAGNICDIVSRALQSEQRMQAMKKLEEMNAKLELLYNERTIELEEQRARSFHSSKMALLGEMAGSIAHEINNPLAIILLTSNQLKIMNKKNDLNPERMTELLDNIALTSQRIEKIVRGLRFFARDAANDNFEYISAHKIIEDTISLCNEKFIKHSCQILIKLTSKELHINCQPVSISQALLNLLGNSFDAVEDMQDKWVSLECFEEEEMVVFRVSDSGPGISKELAEKILLPFFTTKPVGKGTGLGLTIVKGIVEQHKGVFSICTGMANTCFEIRLPKP